MSEKQRAEGGRSEHDTSRPVLQSINENQRSIYTL